MSNSLQEVIVIMPFRLIASIVESKKFIQLIPKKTYIKGQNKFKIFTFVFVFNVQCNIQLCHPRKLLYFS